MLLIEFKASCAGQHTHTQFMGCLLSHTVPPATSIARDLGVKQARHYTSTVAFMLNPAAAAEVVQVCMYDGKRPERQVSSSNL